MHRSEHKLFHTSIPSASHFCTLYVYSCCQHTDHSKTNKPRNASGCFLNITVYLYYSQKNTLHQDAFQKVEEFSPGQNWYLQFKKNCIRILAGKSRHWRLDLLSNQDITSLGFSDCCSFDLKSPLEMGWKIVATSQFNALRSFKAKLWVIFLTAKRWARRHLPLTIWSIC